MIKEKAIKEKPVKKQNNDEPKNDNYVEWVSKLVDSRGPDLYKSTSSYWSMNADK